MEKSGKVTGKTISVPKRTLLQLRAEGFMRSETQEKPRIPGGPAKRWVGSPDPSLGGAWEARVGFVASTWPAPQTKGMQVPDTPTDEDLWAPSTRGSSAVPGAEQGSCQAQSPWTLHVSPNF